MLLLAFSGAKQSGKDSLADFLIANKETLWGRQTNILGTYVSSDNDVLAIKAYFARGMKDFCEYYLGVPHELLWGTDEQKNRLTGVAWESLPHYPRLPEPRPMGRMTARQLLQQVGEEMFLSMNPTIWTDQFRNEFKSYYRHHDVVIVADPRKPEQIQTVHDLGGKAIRLTKQYHSPDLHISELALDPDRYDWKNFDFVLDNEKMTFLESKRELLRGMVERGWCHKVTEANIDWEV